MSNVPGFSRQVQYVAGQWPADSPAEVPSWTYLTNHAHVLICIAQNPEVRLAEIARKVGIGERDVEPLLGSLCRTWSRAI